MKKFNYHYLDITKWEPDFQINEIYDLSNHLSFYKDDFREVLFNEEGSIIKETRFEDGNIFYLFESLKRENNIETYSITLYEEDGLISNLDCYKRFINTDSSSSIFYDQQFPNFNIEKKKDSIFYKYFFHGQLPDYWLITDFIKSENDFEEIIIKDLEGNIVSQIFKVNGIVYSERKFFKDNNFEFYFLGKKKLSLFTQYDEEGKLILKEYHDEEGFHSVLYDYKKLSSNDGFIVTKTEFLNEIVKINKTILIQLFSKINKTS